MRAEQVEAERRRRVEEFLGDIGTSPAQSSSRNPLEQPWAMTPEEFTRRCGPMLTKLFTDARDETAALTEQVEKFEREIDERVAELYGL